MSDFESKPPSVGLWANTGDRGPVASGNCGTIRFVLWKNTKGGPNAPDYRLVMEQTQKRQERGSEAGSAMLRQSDTSQAQTGTGGGDPFDGGDEVPF